MNDEDSKPKWFHQTVRHIRPSELLPSGIRTRSQVHFALLSVEPNSFEEAYRDKQWIEAMKVEYSTIMKNKTWELVELPPGKQPIGCKWVYKTKYNVDGTIDKHKARLVAKGFTQREGIDFTENFLTGCEIQDDKNGASYGGPI